MSIRASKRVRTSDITSNGEAIHQQFTEWAMKRGVEINGAKPAELKGRGLGIVATKKLRQGERILFIPEKAMFRPNRALLEQASLSEISPQAHLTLSAMLAFPKNESGVRMWKSTWPKIDDLLSSMPMGWDKRCQSLLPLSVQQPLKRLDADYARDWAAIETFCENVEEISDPPSSFQYYWMIANNRSFHWKPPRAKSGEMVLCPFIDFMNHGPTGSGCNVTQNAKGYEVHANRDYEAGEELLATYGAHSNDKLLVHYGFICSYTPTEPSPDDEIRLDHLILPSITPEIRSQLQDVGYLGAYALIPSTNELCFKTQVAIRATILTSNEWEHFATNGEDLSVDHTPEVNRIVKGLLLEYCVEALQKVQEIETWPAGLPADLVRARWAQIVDAINAFIHS